MLSRASDQTAKHYLSQFVLPEISMVIMYIQNVEMNINTNQTQGTMFNNHLFIPATNLRTERPLQVNQIIPGRYR